jgi:hypothetical protein
LQTFTFDAVYDWNSNQAQIYEETAKPIVESVMQGYNGVWGLLGCSTLESYSTCNIYLATSSRRLLPAFLMLLQAPSLPMARLEQERHILWLVETLLSCRSVRSSVLTTDSIGMLNRA